MCKNMKDKIINILQKHKVTIIMTFVWGILAHGYAMTNALMYHDGLLVERVGATYVSGRWFLGLLGEKGIIGKLFGVYNLPFLSGMVFLTLVAVTNILIMELFDIKSNISCAILSGVLVVYPTITTMFGYIYTMDYYALAVLMCVFAVWVIKKFKNPWISSVISIVCIVCSMGIYQAYVGFAITLILLLFIDEILNGELDKLSSIMFRGIRYVAILGISYVSYILVNKLFLRIMNVEMVDYQNLNSMGKMTIGSLKQGIIQTYTNFKIANPEIYPEKSKYIYYAAIVIVLLMMLILAIKLIKDKRIIPAVIFVVAMVLLPIGLNSIYIAGALWIYSLMLYSNALLFVVPFIFVKYIDLSIVKKIATSVSLVIVGYLCVFYMTYSNRCYMDATYTQQKTISWMNQMISQIKSTDGYNDDLQIFYYFSTPIGDNSFSADTEYQVGITHYGNFDVRNSYNWYKFMRK